MSKLAVLMSEHLVCVREFSHWWIQHEHFKGLLIYPLLGIGYYGTRLAAIGGRIGFQRGGHSGQ